MILGGSDETKIGLRLRLASVNVRPQGRSTPFSAYPSNIQYSIFITCSYTTQPHLSASWFPAFPCKNLPSLHHCQLKPERPASDALSRLTQVSGASEAFGCDECQLPEWLTTLRSRVAETRQSWWSALQTSGGREAGKVETHCVVLKASAIG